MKIQFCFPKPFSSIALYKHRFAKVKTTVVQKEEVKRRNWCCREEHVASMVSQFAFYGKLVTRFLQQRRI
jgi:hypothetical protein